MAASNQLESPGQARKVECSRKEYEATFAKGFRSVLTD